MATTIHVGNLSFKLTEEDLKKFFSKYGKVTDTYVVRRYGRPKGYGFVEFDSSASVDNALTANGAQLEGRNINIEKAKGSIQKSNFSGERRPPRRNFNNYNNDYNNDYDSRPPRRFYNNNDGDRDRDRDQGPPRRFYNNNDGDRDRDQGPPRRYFNNNPNRFGSRQGGSRGGRGGRVLYSLRQTQSFGGRRGGPNRFNRNSNNNNNNRRRTPNVEKEESLTTVYVSNLPFSVDDAQLAKIFDNYKVKTTHIVQTGSGRSRGYGFVEFETEDDQKRAVKDMDGTIVKGSDDRERNILVKVALVEKPNQNNSDNGSEENKNEEDKN